MGVSHTRNPDPQNVPPNWSISRRLTVASDSADSKPEHIAAWRKVNPDVVLSHYIPFTRVRLQAHLTFGNWGLLDQMNPLKCGL